MSDPVAPRPDALVPVIDVGAPASPTPTPGQMGSQLAPVWHGNTASAFTPPGDGKVQHDFMAGRSLAQAGDPWGSLNNLIGGGGGNQPQGRGQPTAAPLPADDRPVGTRLVKAPQAAQQSLEGDEETGTEGLELGTLVPPLARAAKDIGTGVIETPQAMLRGLLGAAQQTLRAGMSIRDAIDSVLPEWLVNSPMEGEFRKAGMPSGGLVDVAEQGVGAAHEAIPEPSSTTGSLIEQGAQFGVGLKGAEAATAGLAAAAPKAAQLLNGLIAGATTMDPNAPRLSNVIDDIAPNFLTEWLKAKPGQDNQLMERLKSGLEFAGLGALFEGLRHGLGYIKQVVRGPTGAKFFENVPPPSGATTTQTLPQPGAPLAEGPEGVLPPELGGTREPLVEITPRTQGMAETVLEQQAGMERPFPEHAGAPTSLPPEQVSDYIEGRTADNPIRINLLRIGSGDDIRNVLEEVARTIPEPAVQSNEATIRAADSLGISPSDFLAGYQGQNLNAAQTTAMRFVLDSSAKQLIDYAQAALDPATATPDAKSTFVRAFATHRALQEYFVNARAEAGRTLQAWSIMSQQRAGATRAVQQLIEQAGQNNIDQMAADVASLGDPLQVSRLVAASERGSGRDTFLKVFYNTLLSNPRTIVKKLASDTGMVMWNLATNYAAEVAGTGAVPPGETGQLGYGYISSLKDAIRVAGKGLKAGESQFFKQFQTMDWQDKSRLSLLANGAPELIPEEMPTQAGASWLRAALPTSWIGAADDFAKYLNYRAYVRSLAFRDGIRQGLDGPDLSTFVSQTLDNVPDSIHQEALSNALRSTFQEPLTGVAAKMQDLADSINIPIWHSDFIVPLGRIVMPFIKVPTNIARWSYRNTALSRLFPTNAVNSELAQGGATADLARARVWLGTSVALGMADLALNNVVTGRGPHQPEMQRAWRAAGNEPYSIQIPGQRPVSYNMVEPFGLLTGAIADTFNIMKFARDDGRGNMAAALAFGVGQAMLSKTYLQGAANFFEATNDPERSGDRIAQSMAMPFFSPQGVAAAAHAADPYVRAHYNFLENIETRLPYISQGLPPQRTLWGDPVPQRDAFLPFVPSDNFAAKMLSPWPLGIKPESVQPIDRWIWDNRLEFPRGDSGQLGIRKLGEYQSFSVGPSISVQAHLTPEQHDRLQVLAGNELKDPRTGQGARDLLNGLVTRSSPDSGMQDAWNEASPALKAVMVQRIVNRYRAAAKQALQNEYPDLAETVRENAQGRAQQLVPQ